MRKRITRQSSGTKPAALPHVHAADKLDDVDKISYGKDCDA